MFFAGFSALLLIATLSLRNLIRLQYRRPEHDLPHASRPAQLRSHEASRHGFKSPAVVQSSIGFSIAFFNTQTGNLEIAAAVGSALACLCLAVAITRLLRVHRNQQQVRSLLAATLSSIGDAVISTDTRGAITFLNPVAERLTGWSTAEAVGKPLPSIFRIVNQKTRESVENPVHKVLNSGAVVGLANHTILIARDGSELPIDNSGSPIRDEDGKLRGVILVFRDLSERYRAQQELAASEQRYRMLFANNPVPMWIFDEQSLAFLDVNEAAILHYGYTRDEFLSMTLRIRPPDELGDLLADIGQHRTTGHSDGPWRHRKKDGSIIAVEITAVAIEVSGRPAKFVAATDVTAHIQAEAALRRSEEQYRVVVETASDAVITIDENSTIVFASRPVQAIFGHNPEALIGKPLTDLMPEPFRAAHVAGLQRYLDTGQRHISWKLVEFPGRRKDGSEVPLELSIGEMRSGPRRCFTGVVRDVSERRRAQDMLQESKQFAKTVVDTVPLAVSGIDLAGRVLFWNPAAEKMFQWSEAELRGRELPIIPEMERPEFKRLLSELAGGKQLTGVERSRLRKDGKLMICAIWTAPLRSAAGSVMGTIAVLANVTERRRAEEQTRKHLQYLAGYQRELEEFAWAASHRLQDPASTTLAKADMAERQWAAQLPAEGQRILSETRIAAAHLHSLISGLAQYWDVQHKVLSTELVALESILDAAKTRLASELSSHQAKVSCSELPAVTGDRELLLQLFIHILDNALKFRSRRNPEIHVSAESMPDGCIVRIQDNGIGMTHYDIDRAFQLFHRLSRQTPGIGLGLSLAMQSKKRHEGAIWISSQPDGGTTVYLMFKQRQYS
jgi:PAS domain S-box-containing protein